MNSQKFSLDSFITEKMFLDLASCILLVCGTVELFKTYVPLNPLWLDLMISGFVTLIRISIIGDFSLKGLMVGAFNIVPIMLGATGVYELIKNVMGG